MNCVVYMDYWWLLYSFNILQTNTSIEMTPWAVTDLANIEMSGYHRFKICKHDHILSKHRCTMREFFEAVKLWRSLEYKVRVDYERVFGRDIFIMPRLILTHKSILYCEC